MTDVALVLSEDGLFDISLNESGSDLLSDEGFESAVSISLFSDKRVNDEELPIGHDNKRGWWGDLYSEIDGDQIGSKIWTVIPGKATTENLRKVEDYSKEALQWLIDDEIASDILVTAEYNIEKQMISEVEIFRLDGESSKYSVFWDEQKIKRIN